MGDEVRSSIKYLLSTCSRPWLRVDSGGWIKHRPTSWAFILVDEKGIRLQTVLSTVKYRVLEAHSTLVWGRAWFWGLRFVLYCTQCVKALTGRD